MPVASRLHSVPPSATLTAFAAVVLPLVSWGCGGDTGGGRSGNGNGAGGSPPSNKPVVMAPPPSMDPAAPDYRDPQLPGDELLASEPLVDTDLFAIDRVHRIHIRLWRHRLREVGDEERVPCDVSIDGRVITKAGIRTKGFRGSDSREKPAFSLKLNEFVMGQRHSGLDKIILNNAVQDPTFLNEAIGYGLYRRAGFAAPRVSHAVVSVNGEYFGLYVVKDGIDKQFLTRTFGKDANDGNLYEGQDADFMADSEGMDLKNEVEEMRKRDDLEALAAALRSATAATAMTALAPLMDVEHAFRSWAIDAVVGHWDGYWYGNNNYYVYSHPDGRFRMIPHGMDWLFSDRWPDYEPRANQDPFLRVSASPAGSGSSAFARLAEADAPSRERYKKALSWVVDNALDVPDLRAEFQERAKAIEAWPRDKGGTRVANDLASFRMQLPGVLDLLDKRKAFLKTKLP